MDGKTLLTLLLIMAVLVVVIVLYRRDRSGRKTLQEPFADHQPVASGGGIDDWELIPGMVSDRAIDLNESFNAERDGVAFGEPEGEAQQAKEPEEADDKAVKESVLVFTIIAGQDGDFPGRLIATSANRAGLILGRNGLFHAYPVTGGERPLFSMANILEPGNFPSTDMDSFETPGMLFFLRLPAPIEGAEALSSMLSVAEQMAGQLGGELCDAKRRPMSDEMRQKMTAHAAGFPDRVVTTSR